MTRDDIIKLAREAWGLEFIPETDIPKLERFAALVAAAEREACAKVCEDRKHITPEWQLDQHYNQACGHCAAAIRARGERMTAPQASLTAPSTVKGPSKPYQTRRHD